MLCRRVHQYFILQNWYLIYIGTLYVFLGEIQFFW